MKNTLKMRFAILAATACWGAFCSAGTGPGSPQTDAGG